MKTLALAACLLASLSSAPIVLANDAVPTLPTVEIRPHVGWVGHPQNERIVTLETVNVRPDNLTRLRAAAFDLVSALPQHSPVAMPRVPFSRASTTDGGAQVQMGPLP